MKWQAVTVAAVAALGADSALTTALGTDGDGDVPIYPEGANAPVFYPSVRYRLVSYNEYEMQGRAVLQFDVLTRGETKNRTIQLRLYAVLHSETRRQFASVDCETRFDDMRKISHDESGIVRYAMDFVFEATRDR